MMTAPSGGDSMSGIGKRKVPHVFYSWILWEYLMEIYFLDIFPDFTSHGQKMVKENL